MEYLVGWAPEPAKPRRESASHVEEFFRSTDQLRSARYAMNCFNQSLIWGSRALSSSAASETGPNDAVHLMNDMCCARSISMSCDVGFGLKKEGFLKPHVQSKGNLNKVCSRLLEHSMVDLSRVKIEAVDDDCSPQYSSGRMYKSEGGARRRMNAESGTPYESSVSLNTYQCCNRAAMFFSPIRDQCSCSSCSSPASSSPSPNAFSSFQFCPPQTIQFLPPGIDRKVFFPPSIWPDRATGFQKYKRRNNPELEKRRVHFCDYPGCKKVYTKSSHLKAHQRIHTGKFNYE
ncbi:unnamed protein product [Soboliphyme baturini]|uniref:C2H2-type domain-containing protein n=1 Tax=Soboliphyme baturini TaxID=241478 RepID=A0A183J838_9BILA|nr:unnamed protein product [Soboliphyme baturini]